MPAGGTTRKRKSDATDGAAAPKKARSSTGAHADAVALVDAILADRENYPVDEDEDAIRADLVRLAEYARALEQMVASAPPAAAAAAPKVKSKEELEAEAEKVRNAALKGILKQMTWKPSCKTGGAKWSYDGICSDPAVFGAMMNLDGPPKFKMKKFSKEEFEDCIGDCTASVRYDNLYITSKDVTVRWSETGEFKFSGSYGKLNLKDF